MTAMSRQHFTDAQVASAERLITSGRPFTAADIAHRLGASVDRAGAYLATLKAQGRIRECPKIQGRTIWEAI